MAPKARLTTETPITHPAVITSPSGTGLQPRAIGQGRLGVATGDDGRTRLATLRQSGALKLVFPRSFRAGMEAVLVNTAGGVTGGDRFAIRAEAGPGADLTLTTQAAERAYRAQPGETGRITTDLVAGPGARLHWLPQELILFEGARLDRRLTVDLAPDATFLMVETLVLGRAAMGETLRAASLRDRIAIDRAGVPLYREGVDLAGDLAAHLAHPATGGGAGALASLVYAGAGAAGYLASVRALLPATCGASLREDDLLVARLAAPDSLALRRALLPLLDLLTHKTLPVCWRL